MLNINAHEIIRRLRKWEGPDRTIGIRLKKDLLDTFTVECKKHDVTRNAVMCTMIAEFIDQTQKEVECDTLSRGVDHANH